MPDLELVVFDCDGTLSDSRSTIVASVQHAFAQQGLPAPTAVEIQRRVGLSLMEFVQDLAPGEDVDADRLVRDYRHHARGQLGRTGADPLFPGIPELLEDLAGQGCLLAVATGKSRRGLTALLEAHGLLSRFASLQTSDDSPSKPHPQMVLRALDECGVDRDRTVMVGDTVYDMEAARNAGVTAVGVAWGYHEESELLEAGAREVVADLPALRRALGLRPRSG